MTANREKLECLVAKANDAGYAVGFTEDESNPGFYQLFEGGAPLFTDYKTAATCIMILRKRYDLHGVCLSDGSVFP